MPMIVMVNGNEFETTAGTSVTGLLQAMGVAPDSVVVERNKAIIPFAEFDGTILSDGDHLEVLRFVGGG
jgi:sulfur carrier protein